MYSSEGQDKTLNNIVTSIFKDNLWALLIEICNWLNCFFLMTIWNSSVKVIKHVKSWEHVSETTQSSLAGRCSTVAAVIVTKLPLCFVLDCFHCTLYTLLLTLYAVKLLYFLPGYNWNHQVSVLWATFWAAGLWLLIGISLVLFCHISCWVSIIIYISVQMRKNHIYWVGG